MLDPNGKGPNLGLLGLNGWPTGIQHVIESPDLLNLLQTWASADDNVKEEAEQRVIEKFVEDTKVLTVPLSAAMGREERGRIRKIVRKWNSNHTTKCEYLPIIFITCTTLDVDLLFLPDIQFPTGKAKTLLCLQFIQRI